MTAHDRTPPGKKDENFYARVFVDRNQDALPLHQKNVDGGST